jgi:hypothetical protein
MDVFVLHHVSHAGNSDGVHFHPDGEVRIDEQAGDDVKLLGCYSSKQRANDRIERARLFSGFAQESDCFTVTRYEVDHDEWAEGYVTLFDATP